MSSKEIEVFVIWDAESFAPGAAKEFRLSRIDEDGEARPFPIVVIRTAANEYLGYVNACPHKGVTLNGGPGKFFSQDKKFLECGQHGALFEIGTGLCVDGPCKARNLEPIALAIIDGEVCLCGVKLVEDDGVPDPFNTPDDGPVVLIDSD
jgi:nitrite reductase/ring-hydroxylating ferredoxin subunit